MSNPSLEVLLARLLQGGVAAGAEDRRRGAGTRAVPLDPAMARALWQHRGRSQWLADDDFIWPNAVGGPRDYGNLYSRLLKPAARRAGLSFVGWHTLRRTCATLLVTGQGFLPQQVQTWLGHEDPTIAMALYTQLTSDDLPTVRWGTPGRITPRKWVASGSRLPPRPTPETEKRLG